MSRTAVLEHTKTPVLENQKILAFLVWDFWMLNVPLSAH